ncbi:MAG: hypothetical protein ACRCZC_07915, partial [Culicoidibacterales bacterium]
ELPEGEGGPTANEPDLPVIPEEPKPEAEEPNLPELPEGEGGPTANEPEIPELPAEPNPEIPVIPELWQPSEPTHPEISNPELTVPPKFDITLGKPELEVTKNPNQTGSSDNPYEVKVSRPLTQADQERIRQQYIFDLKQFFEVFFIERTETDQQIYYKYHVSKKFQRIFSEVGGNDFYIEFIIDKDEDERVYLIDPPVQSDEKTQQQSDMTLRVEAQSTIQQEESKADTLEAEVESNIEQATVQTIEPEMNSTINEQATSENVTGIAEKSTYLGMVSTGILATGLIILWQIKKR